MENTKPVKLPKVLQKKPGKNEKNGGAPVREADQSLIDAAIASDVAGIRVALGEGASATATDKGGYTALMWAARYDLSGAVQELMPWSDLEQRDPVGKTALGIAREGAGAGSRSAGIIEAYALALNEIAALSATASLAPKTKPKRYGL